MRTMKRRSYFELGVSACAALVLVGAALWSGPAAAAPPLVLGTSQPADTYAGGLQRRIYAEAFKRLGLPVEIAVYPLARLSIVADQGLVDGDVARVHGYAAAHPELVRVEEPVYEVSWALFANNPALQLTSLTELPAKTWRGTYLRGVGVCQNTLGPLLPPERLLDVTSDAQGFSMLLAGRSEFHCTADISALNLQHTAEFKDALITRRLFDIGTYALHPYLHRKHVELAPRLAAAIRQMKAEGLIERYRAEVQRELERARR